MKNLKQHLTSKILALLLLVFTSINCNKDDEPLNKPPTANAGGDRQAEIGSVVKIDASGSTDPDGNTLTYQWSFLSKPNGSVAVIVGVGSKQTEFTLDKAGTYELQVMISDGTTSAQDTVIITNKEPIINEVKTQTFLNSSLAENIAQRGRRIFIEGLFFSPDESENKFSLGGIDCKLLEINNSNYIIEVPDNAIAGDLVVTVGAHSVTWSEPIRLVNPPVINAFIDGDNTLDERERYFSDNYKEIGTVFTPLVNGTIVALGMKTPMGNDDRRVTLWDVATMSNLASLQINEHKNTRYRVLETPIVVQADKQYMISLFNDNWYNYGDFVSQDNIYPKTIENIRLDYVGATDKYDELNDNYDYPDFGTPNFYIPLGAEFVFVPDIQ